MGRNDLRSIVSFRLTYGFSLTSLFSVPKERARCELELAKREALVRSGRLIYVVDNNHFNRDFLWLQFEAKLRL